MHKDQKINLYYWLAAAALAVALMPVAIYVASLTRDGQIGTVIVALIIALCCLSKAVSLAWKDEQVAPKSDRRRKLIPLVLMIVFGLGFIGCAAWFFWPSQLSEAAAAQSKYPPEFMRDGCGGVLHRADGDLRFGGEEGEGESICIINKAEEARILAVCTIGHPCRVKGNIGPCGDSGECDKISKIKSVAVVAELVLPSDAPAWVQTAYRERGQAEIPGPEENSRIVEYFSTIGAKKNYRDDIDDWASAFVEWSLNKNGIIGPKNDDPFAWLNWGQKLDQPRFGCITVLSFSGLRHVGFFFSDNGESILALGGNQDDTVNISRYNKSDVVGYRWPPGQK
jgi:uncharacterized protein (TIGR02594 family)